MSKFNPNDHLMQLKGKSYLPVAWRLVWFRETHPDYGIQTQFLVMEPDAAVCHATITDETGRVICEGTKSETRQGFGDFIEKAETGAVGRALGMLGFGTQFEPDFDEGPNRIVDSPQDVRGQRPPFVPEPEVHRTAPVPEPEAPTMGSLHGLATRKGKTHDDLHNVAVKFGVEHTNEMNPAMRRAVWDSLSKLPDVEAAPVGHTLCMECAKRVAKVQAQKSTELYGEVMCAACCLKVAQKDAADRRKDEAQRATGTEVVQTELMVA